MDTLLDENGHPLPLSSLHLFVPPLRLVSAALWQVVESHTVMDYGLVEEFVVTVLEIVPHLLSFREKVQLIMGLRAQLILELCRCDHLASPEIIQPHLARISNCVSSLSGEVSDPKVVTTVTNFCKMVENLLVDSKQKEVFFKEVFPKDFGPRYDLALQALLWRFLARLEKLIPVPDLREVVLWFSPSPAVLEECVKSVAHPEPLRTLLEYHKKGQSRFHNKVQASSSDKDIFSALSPVTWMKKSVAPEGCPLSSDDEETEPVTGVLYIESQPGRWVLVPDWEVPPQRPIFSSVEVEVEHPEEEEEVTLSRKPAVKRPEKKDAAFFFPKTRGGLKPDRIAAMCKRRQLKVLLSRQDITGLPLPETRTPGLRKGNVLAGDVPFSQKRCQKDITGLPLAVGTLAGNGPLSEPVKCKRGRPRKTEKMGQTRETSPDCPEAKPDGSDGQSALLCRTLRDGRLLTEEVSVSVQVRKRRRLEHSGPEKSATEKEEMKREILPNHHSDTKKENLKTKKTGLWRRRKRRRRHSGLASNKLETIVINSSETDRSGEEVSYITPEESSGKSDEKMMEDSRFIEKPSHEKVLAGLLKARKSAPSSKPFQIQKCHHCPYFHREEEKLQQHMQLRHPACQDARSGKQRRRHPGLASKKETIVSKQDSSETESGEEDFYIIPEDSSGKDDETKMEDSRCTEKPSHKKPLASLPKARKSAPSSKPLQIKKCRHCPYFYREEEKLQQHMQLWHPACPRCGKTFIDKFDLEKHLQTRGEQSCSRCARCNTEFESSVDLEEHVRTGCDGTDNGDNRDEDNRDKDGECSFPETDHTYHLQNNRDEDDGDKEDECCLPESDHNYHSQTPERMQQKCRVCYAELADGIALISHLKIFHIESPFKCFSCGCTFETHLDLNYHQETNANCISNMRRCPICGYVLQQPLDIKRHLARHLNTGELKCKACPMTFLDLSDVRDHLQWSQRCRAKCYGEGQSPVEGHSEKKETKADQGYSQTGNLGGVNVEKKVYNTRHIERKGPSLSLTKVEETRDKKSTKRLSPVPKKVDETRDKESTKRPSLVPKKEEEIRDKKSTKRPSLVPEKVEEIRDKKSTKTLSLVPEKVNETTDKKSTKRPSLVPKKVEETRDKKSTKRSSLVPKKVEEPRDKESTKRSSLVPKNVEKTRDKESKKPSLVPKKVDETRDKKSNRPSLVPEKVEEIRDKKSTKKPSLVPKNVEETRDKESKKPSLVPKNVDETRDKKSNRPSLVPEKVEEIRDKKSTKKPSLVPKKVDETRDKKSNRPSLVPEKVEEIRDKKSTKSLSLVPKKVNETKDKKSTKRPSLVTKKVEETRDKNSTKIPSLVPKNVDETRDKESKKPSLVPKKVEEPRDKKSMKRPSLAPKTVDENRDKESKKPCLVPKKLQETKPKKVDDTRHKQSMKGPSLLPKKLKGKRNKRSRKRPPLKLQEMRLKKVDEMRHKRSMKRPSLLPENITVSKLQQCPECGIVKDSEFAMQRHLKRHYSNGHNKLSDPACLTSSCDSRNRRKKPSRRRTNSAGGGSTLKGNAVHATAEQPSSDQHVLHTEVERESSGERPNLNGCFKVKDDHSQLGEKMGLYFIRRVDFLTTSQPDTLHLLIPTVYDVPGPYGATSQHVDTSADRSVTEGEEREVLVPLEERYNIAPQQVDTSTDQSMEEEESEVLVPLEERYDTAPQQVDTSTDQSVTEEEESEVLVPLEERYDTALQQVVEFD